MEFFINLFTKLRIHKQHCVFKLVVTLSVYRAVRRDTRATTVSRCARSPRQFIFNRFDILTLLFVYCRTNVGLSIGSLLFFIYLLIIMKIISVIQFYLEIVLLIKEKIILGLSVFVYFYTTIVFFQGRQRSRDAAGVASIHRCLPPKWYKKTISFSFFIFSHKHLLIQVYPEFCVGRLSQSSLIFIV